MSLENNSNTCQTRFEFLKLKMNSQALLDMKIISIVQNENAPDGLATRGSYNPPHS